MFLSLGEFCGAYDIFCGALLKRLCEDLRSSLKTLFVLSLSYVLDFCKAFKCGKSQLDFYSQHDYSHLSCWHLSWNPICLTSDFKVFKMIFSKLFQNWFKSWFYILEFSIDFKTKNFQHDYSSQLDFLQLLCWLPLLILPTQFQISKFPKRFSK